MRKILQVAGWLVLSGTIITSFATDARIITMGRNDNFFMDEWSVFRNPANVNYYPNMLMGSLGEYKYDPTLDDAGAGGYAALARNNRDPQKPFFGGIVSYSLNQTEQSGNQYPMISIGGVFNRNDPMLNYVTKGTKEFDKIHVQDSAAFDVSYLPVPVGKIDLMAGYALPNGGMFGIGTYLAFQNYKKNKDVEYKSNLITATLGFNWPLIKTVDLEVSADVSVLNVVGDSVANPDSVIAGPVIIAENDYAIKGDVRLFSAMTLLNGDLVPHVGFNLISVKKYSNLSINGGLGININIDKGFFWAGAECLYQQEDLTGSNATSGVGGRVSFGIERNVWWDWFVVRVGVAKKLMYISSDDETGYWEQNVEADASDEDHAGLGIGLNIENRLKVDVVLAEDVVYTFTNLISGPQHHLANRITVTYSF